MRMTTVLMPGTPPSYRQQIKAADYISVPTIETRGEWPLWSVMTLDLASFRHNPIHAIDNSDVFQWFVKTSNKLRNGDG
jgi:hypothetical protein